MSDKTCYELTLFVSGASEISARAVTNARELCDGHLAGRSSLSVVDVHVDPEAVLSNQVFAVPTLIKNRPLPVRRLVGDLSHTDKVLLALELPVAEEAPRATT
jgi:circadian clock protein KaiB